MIRPELQGLLSGLNPRWKSSPRSCCRCRRAQEATSAVEPAHDFRIGVHRQPVQRIFRKHDQIHGGKVAPRLADHGDDALGLAREVGPRHDHGQLQLNQPDDDAFGRFVEAAKSVHVPLPLPLREIPKGKQTRFWPATKDYFSGAKLTWSRSRARRHGPEGTALPTRRTAGRAVRRHRRRHRYRGASPRRSRRLLPASARSAVR